jgi:transposase InsO family protein
VQAVAAKFNGSLGSSGSAPRGVSSKPVCASGNLGWAQVAPRQFKTLYGQRGSPWENGYIESFNARLRDELLNGEIFYTLREAQIVIENWRRHYNTIRPHASIGYKPPAPEVFVPAFAAWPAALRRPAPPATLAQRPALN